jgi:hypothetical protein
MKEEHDPTYQLAPRTRRMPDRFNEFLNGNELDEVDDMHNLAVYTSNDDPKSYDEAQKLDVWRK